MRTQERSAALAVIVIALCGCGAVDEVSIRLPGSSDAAEQELQSATFVAQADAEVQSGSPAANFGSAAEFGADQSPERVAFVRFSVAGVPGSFVRATLRCYVTNGSDDGPQLFLASNTWSESTLTWNTRPAVAGAALLDLGVVAPSTWVDLDVTSAVKANGTFSFALLPTSADAMACASRETGANAPQLVIQYETAVHVAAAADAEARSVSPSKNFGADTQIGADANPVRHAYVRFEVAGLSAPVKKATLRCYVINATTDGPQLFLVSNAWTESGLTWANRPLPQGAALKDTAAIALNTWLELDVTTVVKGNGSYSFLLLPTSDDAVACNSREAANNRPELLLELGVATVDAGVAVDGGSAVVDGGAPVLDAGTTVLDAGKPVVDSGTPAVDAGTPVLDAGTTGLDAGKPGVDAGTPAVDAGTPVVDAGASWPLGALPKTQYAYPSNALFVSPAGDDAAAGTLAAPLKTVLKAVSKSAAGGTVVLRAGVYREELGTVAKAITLQPYPNEDAWLDGSDVVSGFVADGAMFRKDAWAIAQTLCPSSSCYDPNLVTSANPAAGLPDMVFVDGVPLTQVLTQAEVTATTFYVDRPGQKLFIGVNPAGKVVEASTRKRAMFLYSAAVSGTRLRGFGVRRYASNLQFSTRPGQIEMSSGARGVEFENLVITQSASSGLFISGSSTDLASGVVMRHNQFVYNGASGLTGNWMTGLVMEDNLFVSNNLEKGQYSGTYGSFAGAKLARLSDSTIKNNLFRNNDAKGFWCDLECRSNTVVGNVVNGNLSHGIFHEISYDGLIASNVVYDNGGYGLKVGGQTVRVFNNTLVNNASDDLYIYNDDRLPSQNITVKNNIIAGGARALGGTHLINATFGGAGAQAPGVVVVAMDHNLYFRSDASKPQYVLGWDGPSSSNAFTVFGSALQQTTSREANGAGIDGAALGTLFVNAPAGDFRLAAGARAAGMGEALPADAAAAIGVTAGVIVNSGALVWRAP